MKYNIGDEITYNNEKWYVTKLYNDKDNPCYRVQRKQDNFFIRIKESEIEEIVHQQRLDKVLEKFENGNHGMFYKEFIEDGAIEYYTSTKKFYWTSYSDEFVITLPTVESLIKDLEQ